MDELRQTYRQAIGMYAEPSRKRWLLELDEMMEAVNLITERHEITQHIISIDKWILYYERAIRGLVRRFNERALITKKLLSLNTENFKWFFITVGYDDKIITPDLIRKYSLKVATASKFYDVEYVNERFRKDDAGEIYIHHHTHFLVKTDLPKSRVIDTVYATVKKVVSAKNFVDVVGPRDKKGTYEDKLKYVRGEKTQSKMECVLLDREWRITNNL